MKNTALIIAISAIPFFSFSQTERFTADLSVAVNQPFVSEVVSDIDGESYHGSFGWPEFDGNVYFDLLPKQNKRSFLKVYAGGSYRNMFDIEERGDGRDFEGNISTRQFRGGVEVFEIIRLAYVTTGVAADGISEGLFQTYNYGGSNTWQDGFEVGVRAASGINSVGLYYQSSLNAPSGNDVTAVQWSSVMVKLRSELLKGDYASGFLQLNFSYDQYGYDDRDQSSNQAVDYEGFQVGIGVGVAF